MEGTVHPRIALAILEALRDTDTPDETLLDETFPRSLPRRLGLSGVVENQIRRYAGMQDRGNTLEARELGDLIRLIGRRPDADRVFAGAGENLARAHFNSRFPLSHIGVRLLPHRMRRRRLLKNLRRIARALNPTGAVQTHAEPPSLVVEGCLLARASASDSGCRLLEAAFRVCVERYDRGEATVEHAECEGRGGDGCLWRMAAQSA
ncbi:MAG: hypothetical protein ACE5JR_03455 [Gemmatimonadota bacterium]